jgi:hypothetical protein
VSRPVGIALAAALAVGLLTAPVTVAALRGATAQASTTAATSSSHPYSMPVWLPVRDETYLDCVLSNYGCANTHGHWTTDMVQETLDRNAPANPGVYAMGAGIMHVQVAHGSACRNSGTSNFGTTVWIDHGGGVVSRYGHLSRILYKDGTRLAAGQEFAIMGTTGKIGNCGVPYVDFQVRTRGLTGPTENLDTLKVCSSATTTATWPTALNAKQHVRPAPLYPTKVHASNTSFNQIPKRTVDFPATTGQCIPSSVPATPSAASGVRLAPTGHGRMTVSWAKPAATPRTTSVQVQLSEYHPSTRTWDYSQNEEYRVVSPATCHYAFTGLVSNHLYRATVVLRNGAGFGLSDGSAAVRSVAPPGKPGYRHSFVTRARKSASLHFRWVRPRSYGLPVTGFQVQVRRLFAHHVSAWSGAQLSSRKVSWYRPHVRKHARYQLRVRATYHGGVTAYRYHRMST